MYYQHILLFNDLILLTKQKLNGKTGKLGYEVKGRIDLEEAKIVNVADADGIQSIEKIH